MWAMGPCPPEDRLETLANRKNQRQQPAPRQICGLLMPWPQLRMVDLY